MKPTLPLLCILLFAAGCTTATRSLDVIEWGPARQSLNSAATVRVEPATLPDLVQGDLMNVDEGWRDRWPREIAVEMAKGVSGKSSNLLTAGTDGATDLVLRLHLDELDVGSGKRRYWGNAGASLLRGTLDVEDAGGRLVVKLRVYQSTKRGNTGLALHRDCEQIGEEFGRFVVKQRGGN